MTGDELFKLRASIYWSQHKMANALRVTRRQYQRYETDSTPLPPPLAIRARFLGHAVSRREAEKELGRLFLD